MKVLKEDYTLDGLLEKYDLVYDAWEELYSWVSSLETYLRDSGEDRKADMISNDWDNVMEEMKTLFSDIQDFEDEFKEDEEEDEEEL